jgi:signal transduction histidine kinase
MTITIYRILQEALTNVARHSQASRAIVAISPTNSGIQVSIRDDGRGFTPHESRGDSRQPLGLVGMRERAALIGGTVTIASGIGKGTTITVDLPLQTGIG